MKSHGAYVDDSRFKRPFCLAPVSFWLPSRSLVAYHMERGGMLLHDAVGVNCKTGAATENQGTSAKYMG